MFGFTYYRDPTGDRYVLGPPRALSGEILAGEKAARIVRDLGRSLSEAQLRRLLDELTGVESSIWMTHGDLVATLVSLTGHAIGVAVQPEVVHGFTRQEAAEPEREAVVHEEKHDLNFTFVYPDGSPAGGWAYRLTDPSGAKENDELGDDGLIEKRDVPRGTYQVELKEVEVVEWLELEAVPDTPTQLVARVIGFDDGAAAKVRIFRQYQETDEQVIQEIDAVVEGSTVRCEFLYDETADDARKAEQGIAKFVAEVSLEDGEVWGKCGDLVLEMQLKTLQSVRWQRRTVRPGEDAVIVVRALGYSPGAEAQIELWYVDTDDGPTKVADLTAPIVNGVAEKAIRFEPGGEGAPAFESDTIKRSGELYAVVVIDVDVRRQGRSGILVCDARAARAAA